MALRFATPGEPVPLRTPNELREEQAFTNDVERVSHILTLREGTTPVGSFKFKVFRFPGDIDFMERVHVVGSRPKAIEYIARRLQLMAQRIRVASLEEPGLIYFSELKAGSDEQYHLHGTGHYEYDLQNSREILVEYRPHELRAGIQCLCRDGWVDEEEEEEMLSAVLEPQEQSYDSHQMMVKVLKRHFVLRWSLDELLQGWKPLSKGRRITIEEAIASPTLTKCDVWAFVDGRYIEVTNYFYLSHGDTPASPGGLVPPDAQLISPPLPDYIEAVTMDISHYFGIGNSLKAAKRLWVLSQHELSTQRYSSDEEKKALLGRMCTLAPLFNSPAASLAQAIADFETIEAMLTRYGSEVPMQRVMRQVLRLWKRILDSVPYKKYDIVLRMQAPCYKQFCRFEEEAKQSDLSVLSWAYGWTSGTVRRLLGLRSRFDAAHEAMSHCILSSFESLAPLLTAEIERESLSFLEAHSLSVRHEERQNASPELQHATID